MCRSFRCRPNQTVSDRCRMDEQDEARSCIGRKTEDLRKIINILTKAVKWLYKCPIRSRVIDVIMNCCTWIKIILKKKKTLRLQIVFILTRVFLTLGSLSTIFGFQIFLWFAASRFFSHSKIGGAKIFDMATRLGGWFNKTLLWNLQAL